MIKEHVMGNRGREAEAERARLKKATAEFFLTFRLPLDSLHLSLIVWVVYELLFARTHRGIRYD